MITVTPFTFNTWSENSYLLHDESKEAVIIDPGCGNAQERQQMTDFIEKNELKPVHLLNTHCHIDHILGNKFMAERYGLELTIHKGELPVLEAAPLMGQMFGVAVEYLEAKKFLEEGDEVLFGNSILEVLLTPGHSPASISFFSESDQFVIAGDVLFREGIGRFDLPGGNLDVLMESIETKLFPLGDEVKVYAGHGGPTTIKHERHNNPHLAHYRKLNS